MSKIKKVTSFRKGQLAIGTNNVVLVTGAGDKKNVKYPCFAGVVVVADTSNNDAWPVGTYSETWTLKAFKKLNLSLNKILKTVVYGNPNS